MVEGDIDDHPMELEEFDAEVDDIKEISTVLVEETIENSDQIDAETIDNTAEPRMCLEDNKGSITLIEKAAPGEEGGRIASYLRDNFMVITTAPAKKIPSRYLSGPYVSCHNLCKYGHGSNSEETAKSPSLRNISNGCALGNTASPKESKPKEMVRRLSFPGTRAERQSRLLVEGTGLSPAHKNELKAKRLQVRSNPSSPSARSPLGRKQTAEVKLEKKLMITGSPSHKNCNAAGRVSGLDGKSVRPEGASVSSKPKPPIKKAASMNPRLYRSPGGLPCAGKLNSIKESKVDQPDNVPEKTLYMIEPSNEDRAKEVAEPIMHDVSTLPSSKEKQVAKTNTSKGCPKGIHKPRLSLTVSSLMSTKITTSKKKKPSQPGIGEQEAAGHVHSKLNDSILQDGIAKDTKLTAKSDVIKKKVKRSDIAQSTVKDSPTRKPKFKSGIEVVLPGTVSSPKKIVFKRGRTLGENHHGEEAGSRSLKLKEVIDADPEQTKVESEKVILRHQETSGRKDRPNLNYVIEEKASELVKTRKSKVKALVGAFETVMSLGTHNSVVESAAS